MEKRRFTLKELRKYNGKNGAAAFVAYKGVVYDVSDSPLWRNGRHQASHLAGTDLTGAIKRAPHEADFLKRFPVVGTLATGKGGS